MTEEQQIEFIGKQLDTLAKKMYINVARSRSLKRRAGKSTEAAMYLLAPKGDTGKLRRSIKFLPLKSYDAFVGPDYKIAPHAHLVNNGFIHWKDGKLKVKSGEKFIQRAYEKTKTTVLSELTRLAKKEFELIGRELEVNG